MKNIVYFCPIDWRWIKQRPQFLAENLACYCNVSVIYPWRNRRKELQKKTRSFIRRKPYFTFPTLGGKAPIKAFNKCIAKAQIEWQMRHCKPDYLWLTMPWQFELLPKRIGCPIIYDCMDDYVAIDMRKNEREKLLVQERKLVHNAQHIFVSSRHLLNLLIARYQLPKEKLCLLRNGYCADWPSAKATPLQESATFRIGYFGTIGRWFDFEMILSSLNVYSNLEYHLFGPFEKGVIRPEHERLIVHGVIEHNQIPENARIMDALVMPFVPNEIVQSVDPVKLYEYIYLNKNILCVHYPEIDRFASFVYFYSSKDEYMARLNVLMRCETLKYTEDQAQTFLQDNSWAKRAAYVAQRIGILDKVNEA